MVKNAEKQTPMNKEGLIVSTAEISGLSKADSARAVEAIIESIQKGLKEDKSITLVGFGSFSVHKREAREGRNPRT